MPLYRIKGWVSQPRPFDMLIPAKDEFEAQELAQDHILDNLSAYYIDDDGTPASFEFDIKRPATDDDLIAMGALNIYKE